MNKQFTSLIISLGLMTMLCFLGLQSKAQTLDGETVVCFETTETYTTEAGNTNYVWTYQGTPGTDFVIVSGGTSTSNTVEIQWTTLGNYKITVTYDEGINEISLDITVNPLPIVGFTYFHGETPATNEVCHDNEIRIVATANGDMMHYDWYQQGVTGQTLTDTPQNDSDETITASYPVQVRNTVTGCVVYETAQVSVKPTPNVSITTTPANGNVCSGGSAILLANATGVTYHWSYENRTTAEVTIPNLTNTGTQPTHETFTVTVTDNVGCSNTATAQITINPIPAAGTITGNSEVCVGDQIQLSHATTGGEWSSNHISIATVNGNGLVTGVSNGTAEIIYTITSAQGCSNTARKNVTVHAAPTAGTITGPTEVCPNATIQLTSSISGGEWRSSNTSIAEVSTQGLVTGKAAGNVEIHHVISNANNCEGVAKHNVTVKEGTTLSLADKTSTYDRNPHNIELIHVKYQGQDVGELAWVEYEYSQNGNVLTEMPVVAGTYRVVAKFAGNNEYCPAANSTATLTVNRANINDAATVDPIESQFHTGSAITPEVVVRHGSAVLEEGPEYTVRYANNINAGDAAEVILTGIGNYTGEKTVYFSITEKSALHSAIDNGRQIVDNDGDKYGPGTVENLEDAIAKGQEVLDNPDATQEEIDQAIAGIQAAIDALIECIPFENVVITRWNNTLTVINNPSRNGNYKFTDNKYQWYRKTSEQDRYAKISNATNQYYSVGPKATDLLNADDQYYVTMVTTDNKEACSCAGSPNLAVQPRNMENSIATYPNPIYTTETLYIDLSNKNPEDLNNAVVEVYSTLGILVSSANVTDSVIGINMPNEAGVYIIRVRAQNIDHVEKVIVK